MVSAKGLKYNNEATRTLLYKSPEEKNTAAQLFGSDPEILRAACESEALAPFEIIDLNMGCPVPKIYKNGEGSALLNDLPRAEKIISACKKSGKTITVKFRIGVDEKAYRRHGIRENVRGGGRGPRYRARPHAR